MTNLIMVFYVSYSFGFSDTPRLLRFLASAVLVLRPRQNIIRSPLHKRTKFQSAVGCFVVCKHLVEFQWCFFQRYLLSERK